MKRHYDSFTEFYPFYLSEHRDPTCRRLHFAGSLLILLVLFAAILTRHWWLLLLVPFVGYGFAWVGHFFFERNRPATFTYPLYSLLGDWVMFKDILTGRIKL
ncbi:MAG: Mpo1-like protein [Pyrinomonadaceae bacterium]